MRSNNNPLAEYLSFLDDWCQKPKADEITPPDPDQGYQIDFVGEYDGQLLKFTVTEEGFFYGPEMNQTMDVIFKGTTGVVSDPHNTLTPGFAKQLITKLENYVKYSK